MTIDEIVERCEELAEECEELAQQAEGFSFVMGQAVYNASANLYDAAEMAWNTGAKTPSDLV